MVSEEEYHRVVDRGDYFAILPMLAELGGEERSPDLVLDKENSSADHVLDLPATVALLEKHDLMVGITSLAEGASSGAELAQQSWVVYAIRAGPVRHSESSMVVVDASREGANARSWLG